MSNSNEIAKIVESIRLQLDLLVEAIGQHVEDEARDKAHVVDKASVGECVVDGEENLYQDCVLDRNLLDECIYANEITSREQCKFWRVK